jgi:hypothetical protein
MDFFEYIRQKKIIIVLLVMILLGGMLHFCWNHSSALKKTTEAQETPTATDNKTASPTNSDVYIEPKVFSLNFRSTLDSTHMTTTVKWKKIEHASSYTITCSVRKNGDWEKIDEKTIAATEGKTSYTNKFVYGKTYMYELNVYQNVAGEELYLLKPGSGAELFFIDCKAPQIIQANDNISLVKKAKRNFVKLAFNYYSYYGDCIIPDGFEIYRGESKHQMKLLEQIGIDINKKKSTPQIYKDKTVQEGKNYFYQIRSYVTVNGQKKYGKKSDIWELSTDDSWGFCKTKVIVSEKEKINQIQIVLTSKDNKMIYFGKKYKQSNAVIFSFDNDIGYDDSDLKLNEISYKYKKSEKYQTLSDEDVISIKPGMKLYIRFARKNHKKFYNPIRTNGNTESNNICIYLFSYKNHNAFLHIQASDDYGSFDESLNYIKWRKEDEPWAWD